MAQITREEFAKRMHKADRVVHKAWKETDPRIEREFDAVPQDLKEAYLKEAEDYIEGKLDFPLCIEKLAGENVCTGECDTCK